MIEVRNLVKQYGDYKAVDDISFTIEQGHVYGFLGPNGAGKSTTMNIMTGYLAPTSGEVIIDGHNIMEEPEEAKSHFGYLPEMPPLYSDMTVKEYLTFAAKLKNVPKEKINDELKNAVRRTRLEDVLERLTGHLSKGYKQRVGIAQALIGSPDVIILDEPTIGLDPKQIIEIRKLIRSLANDHTVILSSHILSEVQEVCDHIIIIHKGKLKANGTPLELEKELGSTTAEFTVKSKSVSRVENMLYTIPEILAFSCEQSTENEEFIDVTAKLDFQADIREKLFYACVKADCPLLMLNASGFSLERIFLELTKDKRGIYKKKKVKRLRDEDETEDNE